MTRLLLLNISCLIYAYVRSMRIIQSSKQCWKSFSVQLTEILFLLMQIGEADKSHVVPGQVNKVDVLKPSILKNYNCKIEFNFSTDSKLEEVPSYNRLFSKTKNPFSLLSVLV